MSVARLLSRLGSPYVLLSAAVVVGCGSRPFEPSPTEHSNAAPGRQTSGVVSQAIGPEGGEIALADGFSLSVPAGALPSTVDISVERWETTIPFAAGPAYLLGPEGLTFDSPVRLELPVVGGGVGGDTKQLLTAYWSPKGIEDFRPVERVVVDESLVKVETTHFSVWMAGNVQPTFLAASERFPGGIATDGKHVYWANQGNLNSQLTNTNQGYIARVSVKGGNVELLTPPQEDPWSVALGGSYVYWANAGDGLEYAGEGTGSAIMRVAKTGGVPEQLSAERYATALAVDSTHIYYTDGELGEVRRLPLDGGTPTTIADGQGNPANIAMDDSYVAWTSSVMGTISSYAKLSGAVSVLALNQLSPSGVAVLDGVVYWANEGDGYVSKVPAAGGAVQVLRQARRPAAIAVVDSTVFFTDLEDSCVYSVSTTGGSATILAKDQWVPWNLTASNRTVLWSSAGLYPFEGNIAMMSI
ncbi:MAG: hypothetical protein MUF54_07125 [Polyangiaceae bacterium]|nr:hypothetical protein [Polyangiaceae bacterium]